MDSGWFWASIPAERVRFSQHSQHSVAAPYCNSPQAHRAGYTANTFLLRNIMTATQPNNPLHGLTLETILTRLVEQYGWEELGRRIEVRCFLFDPSIKSSLKFLRQTPWARAQVEALYLDMLDVP